MVMARLPHHDLEKKAQNHNLTKPDAGTHWRKDRQGFDIL